VKQGVRVLILDDEPVVGERLETSLERAGFVVDAFSTSHEAIARLKEQQYDILVTDLKMSGPDGMDVLRTAKEMWPDLKPVVITGFATKNMADEAMRRGAVAFIAKPFKMSYLRSVLEQLVSEEEGPEE